MPVMDIDSESTTDNVLNTVMAYMLYPKSQEKREQFILVHYLREMSIQAPNESPQLPAYMLRLLVNAPSYEALTVEKSQLQSLAQMAGRTMLFETERIVENGQRSKQRARWMAQQYFLKARDANNRRGKYSEDTIKKSAWPQFESVAHFWAANHCIVEQLSHEGAVSFLDQTPLHFLSLANYILSKYAQDGSYQKFWVLPDTISLPDTPWICTGENESDRKKHYKNKRVRTK